MEDDFHLHHGLRGRFAVVKLWPGIQTAEDECIARLKIAAAKLSLECLIIHADGRYLDHPNLSVSKQDVDFVLHLHYDTPKLYDVFSFVALWNPISFYHTWGYDRCSRNLLSHDDFISCSSNAADDHIKRLIRYSHHHLPPYFKLYHSMPEIMHGPSLGEYKLFYAGINWEALGGGQSRHQSLLRQLEKTGALRIYGPAIFQGIQVWAGYRSYVKEIPFDGISIVKEISKAGIVLALSSKEHKQSELMSNRLFEGIAAGALIICDENKFGKKFFGKSLLYIDTEGSVEETVAAILNHIAWAKNNPTKAIAMIAEAQNIFKQKFSLTKGLQQIYQGLHKRQRQIFTTHHTKVHNISVKLNLLMPVFTESILKSHITNAISQEYSLFSPTLIIDKKEAIKNRKQLTTALSNLPIKIHLQEVDFFTYSMTHKIKKKKLLGEVIAQLLTMQLDHDAVIFVAPNETIFSNHIQTLTKSLMRDPNIACAATAAIIKHRVNIVQGVHEKIDFKILDPSLPIGYARFIFRTSALSADLNLALPYLDRKVMAVIIGDNYIYQEIAATVVIQTEQPFPDGEWDEGQENELLASFCPNIFTVINGFEIKTPYHTMHLTTNKISQRPKGFSWVMAQIKALHKEGVSARVIAAKNKLNRLMVLK